ncbi:MAG: hypothetical protein K5776_12645 [Lachnospiraceae bacterium]|nr:hypothetical protein [Lachnospiraceae bacterium]
MKRCVTIAKNIKLLGGNVLFVTREDSDTTILENNFMEFRTVPSVKLGSDAAIDSLKEIIEEVSASVCVVDSYDVSDTAFKSLRKACKVVLIEDYLYEVYDVDCVVNYNLYVDRLDYRNKYSNDVGLLLGMDYAPYEVDGAFVSQKTGIDIGTILVYTGEHDSHELAPGIVDSILDCVDDSVRIRVVTSKNALTRDILYKMSNSSSQIIIEQDVASISKLLKSCDIAVTVAESVICYSLLSSLVPSCVFLSDYSQNMLMASLTQRDLMVYGGDYVNKSNKFYGDLVNGVTSLAYEDQRKKLCNNIAELNLGHGAKNLAKAILNYE